MIVENQIYNKTILKKLKTSYMSRQNELYVHIHSLSQASCKF